jgi:hypothetical protein
MSLLVTLQLELFVLISSLVLWSKALTGTAATLVAAHTPVYKVFFYISIIVSPRDFFLVPNLSLVESFCYHG